VALHVTWLSLS